MNIAGPGGLLVAWALVSIAAICVLEGLSKDDYNVTCV
jgi:amino acid permease